MTGCLAEMLQANTRANYGDNEFSGYTDMKAIYGSISGLSDHSMGSIAAVVGVCPRRLRYRETFLPQPGN
jgi:hypothetical protein